MSKKSKKTGLSDSVIDLIIVAIGVSVLIGIFALYLGAGFYINSQINQLFTENRCLEVAQYSYFPSLYPEGLFGSVLKAHNQYAQCKAVIDVSQAVSQKNWSLALTRARDYLTANPNGVYAAGMNDHVINTLSVWSQELIARGEFGSGIDKLKQLVDGYPDAPITQSALDSMLQAYLVWGDDLITKQDYETAEKNLLKAYDYFPKDTPRSEQLTQALINLYIEWGNALVQSGDMDNGTRHFEQAKALSPEGTNFDLLIAQAHLNKAIELAKKDAFDRALAKVKEVEETATTDEIKKEVELARAQVLSEYSQSDSPQAQTEMAIAMAAVCNGEHPTLSIFGLDTQKMRLGLVSPSPFDLPKEWMARSPGELRYVACVTEEKEKVQSCNFEDFKIIRNRYNWKMTIYDVLTGEKVESAIFFGADPQKCTGYEYKSPGISREYAGARPEPNEIVIWLRRLNLTQ